MNRNSPNFDERGFLKIIDSNWTESPYLDFKKTWKDCLKTEDGCFKLARHIIAFVNTSFRTDKPCFILYGVDNNTRIPQDIWGHFPEDAPDNISNYAISLLMEDWVLQKIVNEMKKWISPEVPEINLEYGDIQYQGQVVFVAWLRIYVPRYIRHIYSLKKSFVTEREYPFRRGDIFIRKGSSSVRVDPTVVDDLISCQEASHLTKNDWNSLINWCKTGELFDAENYLPYLDLRIVGTDKSVYQAVLDVLDSGERKIKIIGAAGSGKSLLIRRIAYKLAFNHGDQYLRRSSFGDWNEGEQGKIYQEDYIVRDLIEELEPTPYKPIPIYFPLRIDFSEAADFESHLSQSLAEIIGDNTLTFKKLVNIPGSRWILLLDGVDELNNVDDRAPKLCSWINALPFNVQVVLTSRSYINIDQDGVIFHLAILNEMEINSLVEQRFLAGLDPIKSSAEDRQQLEVIQDFIQKNREFYLILANHRANDAFLKYFQNKSLNYQPKEENYFLIIPQKGRILRSITDMMREEEVDRKYWRLNAQGLDDDSRIWLEKVAWYSDWTSLIISFFDLENRGFLSREEKEWNEHIGFLARKDYKHDEFICSLYQCYAAAEYSCNLTEVNPIFYIESEPTILVKSLHIELMEAEGKTPLIPNPSYQGGSNGCETNHDCRPERG